MITNCIDCGVSLEQPKRGKRRVRCKDCARNIENTAKRQWRKDHPQEQAAFVTKYRKANPDKVRKWTNHYRQTHPETIRASNRRTSQRWKERHPDDWIEYMRTYNQRRRDWSPVIVAYILFRAYRIMMHR